MQIQSTYWLKKPLKMISLYVNALLCTLQHTVIHAMQLSGVNSENLFNFLYRVRDIRPRWSTRRRADFSCATLYTHARTHAHIHTYIKELKLCIFAFLDFSLAESKLYFHPKAY